MSLNVGAKHVNYIEPAIAASESPAHGGVAHVAVAITKDLWVSSAQDFIKFCFHSLTPN
jgi:hypothetical protein